MRKAVLFLLPLLGACATGPVPGSTPPARQTPSSPPPQDVRVAPSTPEFRAPRVMNVPGLEGVIGRNETALANLFGAPRLNVTEGDAKKLQFTGEACVLDVYLYPLRPGGEPSATYVDARRASDGLDVDRAACVRALRR
ncbi:MAG: hypothetical protein VXY04_06685 [Pseudomonadota bacterium]|uniref:DUF3035 domain-containing protein n=2 Tax=Qipengyuania flava TaxID=192812 RepID=A0A5P6N8Y5_9SPHN|nr:hypothetical protein [Qipengyuania flava]MEC7622791.1 hypothetical protein [Pseudomonadota bacterium]HCS17745.1 hypothetical protein [Erythrobacter sp.]MCA0889012.1 hypothetical protein [Qipengyuania flava]MEC8714890.1 hypothetical protein [Pseudomonadota bacterium]QFI62388.1 hypothetical protein D0Y83_03230 [Qipengyuania flava]